MGRENNRSRGEWRIKVLEMKIYLLKTSFMTVIPSSLVLISKGSLRIQHLSSLPVTGDVSWEKRKILKYQGWYNSYMTLANL